MKKLELLAQSVLDAAKEAGAQSALCTVEETETHEFNLQSGEFTLLRTLFDRSVQLSVLMEGRKGTITVNSFEDEAIRKAVADCVASAQSAEPDEAWEFDSEPRDETFTEGSLTCDTEKLFTRTKELADDIAERHPKIMVDELITEHKAIRSVCKTSGGVTSRSAHGFYNVSLMYSAHDGEKASSFYYGDTKLAALDKPFIDCALIEWELSSIERQLEPTALDGKFNGTVVLAPTALFEIVLSTVNWNFIGEDALIDGTSIWKDKLGQQVADERLSLSFAPRAEDVVVGARISEEGYRVENFDVIRDGKLLGYALTQYGANKIGGVRAGCTGWHPYPHIPAGDKSLEEIVAGIERGVLVMRFSGGEPSSNGDFSGVAKNSFLIENGKIMNALCETMISGSVTDMLNNVRAISSNVLQDGECCLPFIAFDGVTVSGK